MGANRERMWTDPMLIDYVDTIHKNLEKIGAGITKEDITRIISLNKIVFIVINNSNHKGRPSRKENRINDTNIFTISDVKI